ncbi:MAG TPA: prolyl oligopeptidase family serine peptidase [Blastocatellia bacterium]|nr:prolyl oligopeptidase family serine peptidase [Blastocatellia bacterium]
MKKTVGVWSSKSRRSRLRTPDSRLRILCAILLFAFFAIGRTGAAAQQIPYLSELFSRYQEFNRLYTQKRKTGANLNAIDPLRKRAEQSFKQGNIPGIIEVLGEAQTLLAGKKWDEGQRFVASLTLETDRLVIEPNQVLQISVTRMFQTNIEKAFSSTPTLTLSIVSVEGAPKPSDSKAPRALAKPIVIAERLDVGETSSIASRRLLLPDGVYDVVALIEAGGQRVAELRRTIYAIADFTDSLSQMSKAIAAIKSSSDAKLKAIAPLVATPEFQLLRLAQLNRTRGEVELNPNQEIDRIENVLSALAKGENPFAAERGELERAYQSGDHQLVPFRVYVPRSYDGASPTPMVIMLHGPLGDERYYFSGLFDPTVVKGEADRRGWILVGVNGRGRFSSYSGPAQKDVFEVIEAVTRDYKIDATRIYLTGHSTGGFGTWLVASGKPEQFAAIAAVSGGPPAQGEALTTLLERVKNVPAMIAHGAQDGIAPVQLSRTMVAACEKAGLKVTYLEVPEGDHLSVVASTFPAVMDFFEKIAKSK